MVSYGYEALNELGKTVKGSMEAENEEQVRSKLKQQGLVILSIKEDTLLTKDISFSIGKKVQPRDMAVFCRQFVSMNRAGVSILECLSLLAEQTENQVLAEAVKKVEVDVQKGETFADSLKKHPRVFSSLMITTVAAGEASGSLDIALERMAEQFEKSAKTQALVKKAMVYPAMVGIVALGVIVVMLVVIIPSYEEMFADMGTELPAITKAVVAASDFLIGYWFIVVPIVVGIVLAVSAYLKTAAGKLLLSQLAIRIPMFRNLSVKSASSQMSRTLSTLVAAGVPLVEAVDITSGTMQNVLFREALEDARDEIIKGIPLSEPLEKCGLFPPMLYHMIRIGEEAGNTEEMLTKLADYYDEEVEMATQGLMAAMEPMIMLVLAVIVCVLIAAVMSPMMQMYSALDSL